MDVSSTTPGAMAERNGHLQTDETSSGETRREEILAAATRLFASRGFDGTSTREIARDAGAKHSLLFYHFRSKGELYLAVVLRQVEHLSANLEASLETGKETVERLSAYV